MNIGILGTGYVGLVTGACLSSFKDNYVTCMDIDVGKIEDIQNGIIPIYEKGLNALIDKNTKENRLFFDWDILNALDSLDIIFIAVGTPSEGNGSVNLSYVHKACQVISDCVQPKIVVMKSTVPIGTHYKVKQWLGSKHTVVSNPEFLREGTAIEDFMNADRIVIGRGYDETDHATDTVMCDVYGPLASKIMFMDNSSAETVKYAANCLLATKLALWNEVAALCFKTGADIHEVRRGVGSDSRIGYRFLSAGPGYGGSCFPKDTRGLYCTIREFLPATEYGHILQSVIASNDYHKGAPYKIFWDATLLTPIDERNEMKIAILGLAFKGGTDDTRESPTNTLLQQLDDDGYDYDIVVADPVATKLPDIDRAILVTSNYKTAIKGADVVILMTDWPEYKDLDLDYLKTQMRGDVIVDARNMLSRYECERRGFLYRGIGS